LRLHVLCLLALPLCAQQTIFDVPSGDVSVLNQWFYQHQTVTRNWNANRRWIQTNALGFGLGHSLELDATWFNLELNSISQSIPSVGFKWSPKLNGESARIPLRFVAGDMLQLRPSGARKGNWSYLMINAEIPMTHTTWTGGLNTGTSALFGRKTTGLLIGIEQHLTSRWMFQADWFSGNHDLAYLIPGMVYQASQHTMLSLGYQIPNHRKTGFGAIVFEFTRIP